MIKAKKEVELSNCCNAQVYVEETGYCCEACGGKCDIGGKSFKEEDV